MFTDIAIKSMKYGQESKNKDRKKSGNKGLRILLKPNGDKLWRFDFRFEGKRYSMSFGKYPEVSLAEARGKCDAARTLLRQGINPNAHKKSTQDANINCFKALSEEWLITRGKKSETGDARLKRILEKDLIPFLGSRPIKEMTTPELLQVLRRIEQRGAIETAHRAKHIVSQIFQFSIASGRAENDITLNLKRALKTPQKTHFSAITDPKELTRLMIAIKSFMGTPTVAAALELSPLLLCRPGELRHMEWDEVNWNEKRIELPASKMKMKQPHVIPLSTRSIEILSTLRLLTGFGKYVFPSARGDGRPMSENAVRVALRTLGFTNDEMTAHGFRATARTILDEVLEFPVHLIEHQLAHVVKDTNGTAYNRTKHLEQRRVMMQKWSDYLNSLIPAEVLNSHKSSIEILRQNASN